MLDYGDDDDSGGSSGVSTLNNFYKYIISVSLIDFFLIVILVIHFYRFFSKIIGISVEQVQAILF